MSYTEVNHLSRILYHTHRILEMKKKDETLLVKRNILFLLLQEPSTREIKTNINSFPEVWWILALCLAVTQI